jgi:hypothetical protein
MSAANYPGDIDANGVWAFPQILSDKKRSTTKQSWQIFVNLRKIDVDMPAAITKDMFAPETLPGYQAQFYTRHGSKTLTTSAVTTVVTNSVTRNPLVKAMNEAKAKYDHYLKKHNQDAYTSAESESASISISSDISAPNSSESLGQQLNRYHPMLFGLDRRVKLDETTGKIIGFEQNEKSRINFAKYPYIYMQRKINDVRVVAYLTSSGALDMYMRGGNKFEGFNEMKAELHRLLTYFKTTSIERATLTSDEQHGAYIYLDGGIYKHGGTLQQLSGCARLQTGDPDCERDILFYIFDVFIGYPIGKDIVDQTFEERLKFLTDTYNKYVAADGEPQHIKMIGTDRVTSDSEILQTFQKYIDEGYEGAILRLPDGPYLPSTGGRRTNYAFKLKPRMDGEYRIVGFTCGVGSAQGAIIWILATKRGIEFNAVPLGTLEERRRIYDECMSDHPEVFNTKYLNKMMTVQYNALSENEVPQQAQAVAIREIE